MEDDSFFIIARGPGVALLKLGPQVVRHERSIASQFVW